MLYDSLFNFLLTQKSVREEMPYDIIEQIIYDSIQYVKDHCINARIANLVLNLKGKLVLAQVYVERKNGFAPTKEQQFGTTPTSYNVQIRFPFGLETQLKEDTILLPSSDFQKSLTAYCVSNKVFDEVQRDYTPEQMILGPGVHREIEGTEVILRCQPKGQQLRFNVNNEIGKGFITVYGKITEYSYVEDYNLRLKKAGVYPLFYSSAATARQGLLRRHDYRGYTNEQLRSYEHESKSDGNTALRAQTYSDHLEQLNQEILASEVGQYWNKLMKQGKKSEYVFNLTVINGITLYTNTGLPLIRLRDYQLKLFHHCLTFIEKIGLANDSPFGKRLGGKIDMGVGAGKTFFTFTLLQYLKNLTQLNPGRLAPAFSLSPDEAIAEVTKKSINRQGVITGVSAVVIAGKEQMPTQDFMALYQELSNQAADEAKQVDDYLEQGLQAEILEYCRTKSLHPSQLMNLMYSKNFSKLQLFKDSIELKRLLLLVESQHTIKSKTGMLGISAINDLLEQFNTLKAGISAGLSERNISTFFADVPKEVVNLSSPEINYNQAVELPASMNGALPKNQINIATLNVEELAALLNAKCRQNKRWMRDDLLRLACLRNKEAAVLLANSGGLGNTHTIKQIEEQIKRFLPDAVAQIKEITNKNSLTGAEHYQLYLYLNNIFSTIPSAIHLKNQNTSAKFEERLYQQSLQDNLNLIDHIQRSLQTKIKELSTVESLEERVQQYLQQFNIQKDTSLIKASDQLAGIASMQLTDTCMAEDVNLLLTHTPIFIPEGMASYLEHLASLEGQAKVHFKENHGVYQVVTQGLITQIDIQNRIRQFLSAVMIADEIHKEEFKFLYDVDHPIYQRINTVTQKYLHQTFKEVLPHRLGMSGTMNEVAEKAFGNTVLYSLSTPQMIQQGLMKKVSVDKYFSPCHENPIEELAKQLVVDYFLQVTTLSLPNVLSASHNSASDLFQISKGLIFSKTQNLELNARIVRYFNVLTQDGVVGEDLLLQEELFTRINQSRRLRAVQLQNKLRGITALSPAEIDQINLYNHRSPQPIIIQDAHIRNAADKEIVVQELRPEILQRIQHKALQNNTFSIYMEYILSKSSAPKELSDIVGLQNTLFEQGIHLSDLAENQENKEAKNYLALISTIDTRSITQVDVTQFIKERVHESELSTLLIDGIMRHKNNPAAFAKKVAEDSVQIKLEHFITQKRECFESGKTLVMLGGVTERTGYSHEPIGIIMDVPATINSCEIVQILERLQSRNLTSEDMTPLLRSFTAVIADTFSYHEKNQAGGRALRTPYGHVRYVEYQTSLHQFTAQWPPQSALQLLKFETSFEEIFTSNETLAQEARESITFNREAILLLDSDFSSIDLLDIAIRKRMKQKFTDTTTHDQYNNYIQQRLPLLWAIKYQPSLAKAYFSSPNESLFDELRQLIRQPVIEAPEINRYFISQIEFERLLTQLRVKIDQLIKKDEEEFKPEYFEVAKEARFLKNTLTQCAENYFTKTDPSDRDAYDFKQQCLNAINRAKTEMSKHRGWGRLHPILRGIIGLFATLTVIPALIVAHNSKNGYKATFFGQPPTDSLRCLEEFEGQFRDHTQSLSCRSN